MLCNLCLYHSPVIQNFKSGFCPREVRFYLWLRCYFDRFRLLEGGDATCDLTAFRAFNPRLIWCEGKMLPWNSSKMDEAKVFLTRRRANWNICSLLSQSCSSNFPKFSLSYWRPILITRPRGLITRKGILPTPEMDETEGFQCLGHSNWTICSLLSQFCFPNFPNFSLLSWETNSYYPRERKAENRKREFTRNGWETGVWVPGAFKLDH